MAKGLNTVSVTRKADVSPDVLYAFAGHYQPLYRRPRVLDFG